MFREKRSFQNSRGLNLSAIFEGENRNSPVVVTCHGFHSSKDNPLTSRALARKLIAKGLSVLRFDFTGHGASEGNIDEITPLAALDDLISVVKTSKRNKVALYGSSFGGYVALLYASNHPTLALALKAPVSDWSGVQISKNRGEKFYKETRKINIYQKAKNINDPTLIIHGDEDDVVPLAQSQRLLKSLGTKVKKLEIIHGASHDIRDEDLENTNTQIADFFQEIFR